MGVNVKQQFKKNGIICSFKPFFAIFGVLMLIEGAVAQAGSQNQSTKKAPIELKSVGVTEHRGQKVDLSGLRFTDSADSKEHLLQDYFASGRPVMINLIYFECPMLCTLVLNGLNSGMKELDWSIGKEFDLITVSINPADNSELAKAKKATYLKSYLEAKPTATDADHGWHFLTGSEEQIQKLADQLGFGFKYDSFQKEYLHPSVTFVLNSDGTIMRDLYGVAYQGKDLRLALTEASNGNLGNFFDRLKLYFYEWVPGTSHYSIKLPSKLKHLFQKI